MSDTINPVNFGTDYARAQALVTASQQEDGSLLVRLDPNFSKKGHVLTIANSDSLFGNKLKLVIQKKVFDSATKRDRLDFVTDIVCQPNNGEKFSGITIHGTADKDTVGLEKDLKLQAGAQVRTTGLGEGESLLIVPQRVALRLSTQDQFVATEPVSQSVTIPAAGTVSQSSTIPATEPVSQSSPATGTGTRWQPPIPEFTVVHPSAVEQVTGFYIVGDVINCILVHPEAIAPERRKSLVVGDAIAPKTEEPASISSIVADKPVAPIKNTPVEEVVETPASRLDRAIEQSFITVLGKEKELAILEKRGFWSLDLLDGDDEDAKKQLDAFKSFYNRLLETKAEADKLESEGREANANQIRNQAANDYKDFLKEQIEEESRYKQPVKKTPYRSRPQAIQNSAPTATPLTAQ